MKLFAETLETEEFRKEFRKLEKRYHSLSSDFQSFLQYQLFPFHKQNAKNRGIVLLSGLGLPDPIRIYKARKFACRALRKASARSGLRVVYSYRPDQDELLFLEIFSKTDKSLENRRRLKEAFCQIQAAR